MNVFRAVTLMISMSLKLNEMVWTRKKFRSKFFRKYWTVVFQSCSFSKKTENKPLQILESMYRHSAVLPLYFAHTHLNVHRNSMLRAICVLSNGARVL